jgi:antitoxin VapB
MYRGLMMATFIKRTKTEEKKLGPRKTTGRVDWERLEALVAKVKAAPALNEGVSDDEVVGYDQFGVPR